MYNNNNNDNAENNEKPSKLVTFIHYALYQKVKQMGSGSVKERNRREQRGINDNERYNNNEHV